MTARELLRSLVVATATLSAACGQPAPEEVESAGVAPVLTTRVSIGTVRDRIRATGVVQPAPGADLLVVAPDSARIAEMPRAEGELVRRGDLLVRFEIPSLTAELERQQAEVRRAEASVATAQAARARAHDLYERGVAARREVEEADRGLADAQATLAQAQASRTAAAAVASRTVVHASFDGIVARRWHNPGDLVEATASDPILRVVDLDRLEVVASVPLAEAGKVVSGAAARLTAGPPGAVNAALTVVSRPASVEQGTATVPVRLALASGTQIPVNAAVEVTIDGTEHEGLIVPARAIVHEGSETTVYVVAEGTAHRRMVTLGVADDQLVEVTAGIDAGDEVIVEGQAGLPDGATVAPSVAPVSPADAPGAVPGGDGAW